MEEQMDTSSMTFLYLHHIYPTHVQCNKSQLIQLPISDGAMFLLKYPTHHFLSSHYVQAIACLKIHNIYLANKL
eukprot:5734555-Ditylum_brightwellii.AAC.1